MKRGADVLQIIADPRRQEILRLVWDDEALAGDIARAIPDITFGAVSQHLKVLRDAGLVHVRRAGRFRWYRANQAAMGPLADFLASVWSSHLMQLRRLAEADERKRRRTRG
ncbi:MAG TPA: metalloregulator ArsR/SmtB family transcription factor [Gemmatimonadales bacterium]|jgi:DNA-binding transcriptional ArsR family regulator